MCSLARVPPTQGQTKDLWLQQHRVSDAHVNHSIHIHLQHGGQGDGDEYENDQKLTIPSLYQRRHRRPTHPCGRRAAPESRIESRLVFLFLGAVMKSSHGKGLMWGRYNQEYPGSTALAPDTIPRPGWSARHPLEHLDKSMPATCFASIIFDITRRLYVWDTQRTAERWSWLEERL